MAIPTWQSVVRACFGDGLPERLATLVGDGVGDAALADYALNPVLSFGIDAPVRLAVAEQDAAWIERVQRLWPHARTKSFLSSGPRGCRRMIDTDGTEVAALYLDDLQDHGVKRDGRDVLCLRLSLPDARLDATTWGGTADPRFPGGRWATRSRGRTVLSRLWVSEARWTDQIDATADVIDALDPPETWRRLRALPDVRVYPDAVEVFDDHFDVTVGLLAYSA